LFEKADEQFVEVLNIEVEEEIFALKSRRLWMGYPLN